MDDYEVKTERELIAEDICDWFDIVFASSISRPQLNKGILVGLIYALKSCRYMDTEALDNLTTLLIYKLPIDSQETHIVPYFE